MPSHKDTAYYVFIINRSSFTNNNQMYAFNSNCQRCENNALAGSSLTPQDGFEVELGLPVQVLHAGGSRGGKEHVLLLMPRSSVVDGPPTFLI